MSELHYSSPFHPTLSNLPFLSQWITKFSKSKPRICSRGLSSFLNISLYFLFLRKHFLHLKKKYPLILPSYKTTALWFASSSTSWKSLLSLLYFLSTIQSSRYLAYMITRNLSVLNNVHSGLLIVNPNGFLKVLSYLNSLVGWILFTTTYLNRNPPFPWITWHHYLLILCCLSPLSFSASWMYLLTCLFFKYSTSYCFLTHSLRKYHLLWWLLKKYILQ